MNIKQAYLSEVLVVETCEGNGSQDNPFTSTTTYWSKDGRLLATANGPKTTTGNDHSWTYAKEVQS